MCGSRDKKRGTICFSQRRERRRTSLTVLEPPMFTENSEHPFTKKGETKACLLLRGEKRGGGMNDSEENHVFHQRIRSVHDFGEKKRAVQEAKIVRERGDS